MAKKVLKDDAEHILKQVVEAMQDKKGKNIVSLNMIKIPNAVTSYFVICHAQSKTQVGAIYDNVVEFVKKQCGINPFHREGYENSEWILIDYIDVVVHIFQQNTRNFYKLEELWADARLKTYKSDE
jgi:ribosome-associated protein